MTIIYIWTDLRFTKIPLLRFFPTLNCFDMFIKISGWPIHLYRLFKSINFFLVILKVFHPGFILLLSGLHFLHFLFVSELNQTLHLTILAHSYLFLILNLFHYYSRLRPSDFVEIVGNQARLPLFPLPFHHLTMVLAVRWATNSAWAHLNLRNILKGESLKLAQPKVGVLLD